jgi:hypothetical protein
LSRNLEVSRSRPKTQTTTTIEARYVKPPGLKEAPRQEREMVEKEKNSKKKHV